MKYKKRKRDPDFFCDTHRSCISVKLSHAICAISSPSWLTKCNPFGKEGCWLCKIIINATHWWIRITVLKIQLKNTFRKYPLENELDWWKVQKGRSSDLGSCSRVVELGRILLRRWGVGEDLLRWGGGGQLLTSYSSSRALHGWSVYSSGRVGGIFTPQVE